MNKVSNICKFNFNRSSDLICENFIYETEKCQSEQTVSSCDVINIVVKGKGMFTCCGKSYDIRVGSLFFILKQDTFSITSDEELEYSYISFRGRRAGEYLERLGIDEINRVFDDFSFLIPFWIECLEQAESGNIDMISEAVLLYSMARLAPFKREHSDIVSKIITLTHDNFTDPGLSLGTIAEQCGYDAKYLSSVFKKKRGVAYTAYLREMRIKHALFLMENGVLSVKNVALLCGFKDALYFSKVFSHIMGKTPSEYIDEMLLDKL